MGGETYSYFSDPRVKYTCDTCNTEMIPKKRRRSGWGRRNFDIAPFCPKCGKFKRKYTKTYNK